MHGIFQRTARNLFRFYVSIALFRFPYPEQLKSGFLSFP